jgi:hypothetical protein
MFSYENLLMELGISEPRDKQSFCAWVFQLMIYHRLLFHLYKKGWHCHNKCHPASQRHSATLHFLTTGQAFRDLQQQIQTSESFYFNFLFPVVGSQPITFFLTISLSAFGSPSCCLIFCEISSSHGSE